MALLGGGANIRWRMDAVYRGRPACDHAPIAGELDMIVSHQHRYIFVPMPKTGTHSVRQALREHLGPDDIEQVGLFVNKRFPFDDIARIKHGHLSVRQVRPYLGDEVADGYFKFTFVRNPFDRFVSYCSFMTRQTGAFDRDPKGTMRRILWRLRSSTNRRVRGSGLLPISAVRRRACAHHCATATCSCWKRIMTRRCCGTGHTRGR